MYVNQVLPSRWEVFYSCQSSLEMESTSRELDPPPHLMVQCMGVRDSHSLGCELLGVVSSFQTSGILYPFRVKPVVNETGS